MLNRAGAALFEKKLFLLRGAILLLAISVSLLAGRHFYQLGATNLYGDGVAHLNIARRVIDLDSDSWWEHYAQLGSPWLPWPHLLVLPLIWQETLWRSGLAGSIVSMVSYVIAVSSSFEIGWRFYHWQARMLGSNLVATVPGETIINQTKPAIENKEPIFTDLTSIVTPNSALAGIWAAVVIAANPSLLYLQTTPMTEVIFLACYLSAIWALLVWESQASIGALLLAGVGLTLAALTRYEAWPVLGLSWLWVCLVAKKSRWQISCWWGLMLLTGPLYWLWHNWATYGNAWEFYNGFYSAKGIYLRLQPRLGWADFVRGNWLLALLVASTAAITCSGLFAYLLAMTSGLKSVIGILLSSRSWAPNWAQLAQLLLVVIIGFPFLFIIYSLYSGNIQIYPWAALSLLNVRYGITLLLPLAFWPISWLVSADSINSHTLSSTTRRWFIGLLTVISLQYGMIFAEGSKQLAVLQEPYRNNYNLPKVEARQRLAARLQQQAVIGKVLLAHGELLPIVSESNLRFRDVILSTGQVPLTATQLAAVQQVVVREDETLWQTLQQQPEFLQQFRLVYYIDPFPRLMLWQRTITGAKLR
jgi:hypothetical protein